MLIGWRLVICAHIIGQFVMTTATENFEKLCGTLYGGSVKAADFKALPGTAINNDREAKSQALLHSMERVGITVDGILLDPNLR
jgi:hypothetical protein